MRNLVLAIVLATAFMPLKLWALALGSISAQSNLEEPLNARIEIASLKGEDPSQISVQLASPDDFQRAGILLADELLDLSFRIVQDGPDQAHIRITSDTAVTNPFLNFLIEMNWPRGRLLREYSLLLDPAVYVDQEPEASTRAPVTPPPAQIPQPAPEPTPQPAPRPVVDAPPEPSLPEPQTPIDEAELAEDEAFLDALFDEAEVSNYGPVSPSETLWSIAKQVRPEASVTVQQMMVALYQANPDAFLRNNMNLLQKGAVLQVPDLQAAAALDQAEALSIQREHQERWQQLLASKRKTPKTAAPVVAKAPEPTPEPPKVDEGRLTLVVQDSAAAADASGAEGGADAVEAGYLRDQLSLAEEELDTVRRENSELMQRLMELEKQLSAMQRLLDVKNEELARVQTQLLAAQEQASLTSEPVPQEQSSASETTDDLTETVDWMQRSLDWLSHHKTWLIGVGALLIILVCAAFLISRRNSQDDDEYELDLSEDAEDLGLDEGLEELQNTELFTEPLGGDTGEAISDTDLFTEDDPEDESEATPSVIDEVDHYVAFGRYQPAIEILQKAIASEPTRGDLQLKLLEIYAQTQDKDAFSQQVRVLETLLSPGDVLSQRFVELRDSFAAEHGPLAEPESEEADLDPEASLAQLRAELETQADEGPAEPDSEAELVEEHGLDDSNLEDTLEAFDLDDLDSSDELTDDLLPDTESVAEPVVETTPTAEPVTASTELADLDPDFEPQLAAEISHESDELSLPSEEPVAEEAPNAEPDDFALEDLSLTDLSLDAEAEPTADAPEPEASPLAEAAPEAAAESDDFAAGFAEDLSFTTAAAEEPVAEDAEPEPAAADAEAPILEASPDILAVDALLDVTEEPATAEPSVAAAAAEGSEEPAAKAEPELTIGDPGLADFNLDDLDFGDDLEFDADFASDDAPLSSTDEAATKLDLARAYIDMGDREGAKDILDEVMVEGNDDQKSEAKDLLVRLET